MNTLKKERTKRLIKLSENLHRTFLEKNQNTTQEVLFQKKSKRNGKYLGITRNYIKIYKESSENLQNTVEIVNLSDFQTE